MAGTERRPREERTIEGSGSGPAKDALRREIERLRSECRRLRGLVEADRTSQREGVAGRLSLLTDAAHRLTTTDDPARFLDLFFRDAAASLGLDIHLYRVYEESEEGARLKLDSCAGVPRAARRAQQRIAVGKSVCGTVAARREPIVVHNVDERTDAVTAHLRSLGVRAFACHPLVVQQRLLGTVGFGTRSRAHFADLDHLVLRGAAALLALAMDRARGLDEVRDAHATVERAKHRRAEFLALMSHELRTPLNAIIGYTDLLDAGVAGELNGEQKRHVERVAASARHLRDFIGDVLSRSAADELVGEPVSRPAPDGG